MSCVVRCSAELTAQVRREADSQMLSVLADHRLLQPTTFSLADQYDTGSGFSVASTSGHAATWHRRFAPGEGTTRAYSEPEIASTLSGRRLTTVV